MKKLIKNLLILLFWIFIWEITYRIINKPIVLPSPKNIIIKLMELIQEKNFYFSVLNSVKSIGFGFTIAYTLGIFFALLNLLIPITKDIFLPIFNILRVTPIASFIILALVFMKVEKLPILVCVFMVLPLVWRNAIEGFKAVDYNLIEMSEFFKVSKISQLKNIYLPYSLPFLLAAVHTGFGYAWKSVITAEVMASATMTIGSHIADGKIYLNTDEIFAWTIVVIIMSILTEKIILFSTNIYLNKSYKIKGDSN
ncbi:MAG: ABC transporter permease subunit [Miniphocaeibacter sp.]|uniref:ABC transporter permease n=1 Tax=Miniphocaeibacter sp. TaxID=3100973 RepID=UPI0017A6420B|nr:ABC transporter permease subunit [Gallicola sp.]